ncbi:MAG: class III extradiol dioxygenase subunit B-like domain-containing protein [Patescibacteria group bacterium]|jgi:aromatic ring-opening dioxygenase LigB subunit
MSLTTIALLPHSPLLIPEIGRANYNFLAKTTAAYEQIIIELKTKEVDTVIIVSPHGPTQTASFTLSVAPEMEINFQDFGFIPPKTILNGDALLADQIQAALRPDFPLQLISESIIDSGSAVPLYLLKNSLPNFKILLISPATDLSLAEQIKFGERLQAVIFKSDKNIAVIASGDLSHRLKKKSPGGYSPKGAKFDNKLIEYLSEPLTAVENIIKIDQNLIKAANECGLKPLTIILGMLNNLTWQSQVLAYQTDFGIGYLSMNFNFTLPTKTTS